MLCGLTLATVASLFAAQGFGHAWAFEPTLKNSIRASVTFVVAMLLLTAVLVWAPA
jgi:hypothetical protein